MTHVNFIERKTRPWSKLEFNYFWILILTGLLILLGAAVLAIEEMRLAHLHEESTRLDNEIVALKAAVKNKAGVNGVQALPEKIAESEFAWHLALGEIVDRCPLGVQLTQIEGSVPDLKKLAISGVASDLSAILRTQFAFESLPRCHQIKLGLLTGVYGQASGTPLRFQFECLVQG